MLAEAERMSPLETGGVLVGYWTKPCDEAVVTHVTGPGPRAVHARHGFLPDDEFQEGEIARAYRESGRLHTYLGDWHTHPGADAYLSGRDKRTLRKVAVYPGARASIPLMAVFGGGPEWTLKVWRYEPARFECFGLRVKIRPLQIQVYS